MKTRRHQAPVILDQFGKPVAASATWGSIYEGANWSRHRGYVPDATGDAAATAPAGTRLQLLSLARYLFANVGFVKGAIRDIARYSVGKGILPQSQIAEKPIRQAYEDYWKEWCKIPEVSGRWNYNQICFLSSVAIDVDGDIGRIYTETPEGFPQLQMVLAHRIGGGEQKNGWTDGVKLNSYERAVSYRVIGTGDKTTDVSSYNFGLLSDPDRMDEIRGKSSLHHAINNLRDVMEILSAEKLGVKMNSLLAMIVKSGNGEVENGFLGKTTEEGTEDSGLRTIEQLYAGAIPRLKAGEDIFAHQGNRPSTTFAGFLDSLYRDVAAGLDVPVEFLWNAEKVGGAGQRFIIAKAARKFEERQCTLIKMCARDWGYVIGKAVKRGDLPFHPDWHRVIWQTPAKITVDVGREAAQNREDIKAGLRTLAEDAAERGVDWEDHRDQRERETVDLIKRAKSIAKEMDVDFFVALQLLQNQSQAGQPGSPNTVAMQDQPAA